MDELYVMGHSLPARTIPAEYPSSHQELESALTHSEWLKIKMLMASAL